MTIQEALTKCDGLKPSQYDDIQKIGWLSDVEATIKKEIIDTHDGGIDIEFNKYDENTDYSTKLIASEPYSDLYVQYLMAQIDYYNAEFQRYNNTSNMFNAKYQDFANYWNRTHMSNGKHNFEV